MLHVVCQLMKRGKGLSIVAGVLEGAYEAKVPVLDSALASLQEAMAVRGIEGFPEMICSPSLFEGYKTLVTAKGLGGLRPNTVMLAWPKEIATDGAGLSAEEEEQYCSLLKHVTLAKKTLLICKFGDEPFPASGPPTNGLAARDVRGFGECARQRGFIDVWWIFDLFPANGLMLLLPCLLQQHSVWKRTKTRLFAVCAPSTDLEALRKLLTTMISSGG